jgi:hypothetical protein
MEVGNQFHAPASLSPAKKSPINPVDYVAACVNTIADLCVVVKIKCYLIALILQIYFIHLNKM